MIKGSIDPSTRPAKTDSNIPSRGRSGSFKCPTPGPTKTIKSSPHAQGNSSQKSCVLFISGLFLPNIAKILFNPKLLN